ALDIRAGEGKAAAAHGRGAADLRLLLEDDRAQPRLGRAQRRREAGETAAYDHQVRANTHGLPTPLLETASVRAVEKARTEAVEGQDLVDALWIGAPAEIPAPAWPRAPGSAQVDHRLRLLDPAPSESTTATPSTSLTP